MSFIIELTTATDSVRRRIRDLLLASPVTVVSETTPVLPVNSPPTLWYKASTGALSLWVDPAWVVLNAAMGGDVIRSSPQTLTQTQKAVARANVGARQDVLVRDYTQGPPDFDGIDVGSTQATGGGEPIVRYMLAAGLYNGKPCFTSDGGAPDRDFSSEEFNWMQALTWAPWPGSGRWTWARYQWGGEVSIAVPIAYKDSSADSPIGLTNWTMGSGFTNSPVITTHVVAEGSLGQECHLTDKDGNIAGRWIAISTDPMTWSDPADIPSGDRAQWLAEHGFASFMVPKLKLTVPGGVLLSIILTGTDLAGAGIEFGAIPDLAYAGVDEIGMMVFSSNGTLVPDATGEWFAAGTLEGVSYIMVRRDNVLVAQWDGTSTNDVTPLDAAGWTLVLGNGAPSLAAGDVTDESTCYLDFFPVGTDPETEWNISIPDRDAALPWWWGSTTDVAPRHYTVFARDGRWQLIEHGSGTILAHAEGFPADTMAPWTAPFPMIWDGNEFVPAPEIPGSSGPAIVPAPTPSDVVRYSPQSLTDEARDQVQANLGLPPKGTYLFADADRGAPLGNDRVAVRFGPDSESTPLSLTANGLWIGGNSSTLGAFTAVRGLEGWATMEGTDGGVAFRWKSDNPESDKLGFAFDFEGPFLAAFGNINLTALRKYQMPDRDGTLALLEGPQTFTGNTLMPNQTADSAASAMNRALVERAGLFSMLTAPPSDLAIFTLNSGAGAGSGGDGDTLSSGTAANARPNGYRWRNLDRNPGGSGSLTLAVRSMLFSCMGTAHHPGSSNADGKMRCGIGIVTGSGAPAGEDQPLAGRGWGWEIFWDPGTAKIRFRLFAHNGSVFVTNDGLSGRAGSIDTGILPSNVDAMFFVCMGLDAAGLVSAWAAFGTLEQIRAVNRITPILTLAGGPTSGTVASTGFPSWHSANHSTVAPAIGMQFRISARSLVFTNP